MTTKEMLQAEIEKLPEAKLGVLLEVARGLADVDEPKSPTKPGLMSRLRKIEIDAPEDFAANLDLYVSGAKQLDRGKDLR